MKKPDNYKDGTRLLSIHKVCKPIIGSYIKQGSIYIFKKS